MQMLVGLSNTDALILLGLFLFFIIVAIAAIIEGLMILALPFVLIKSLFSKDKKETTSTEVEDFMTKIYLHPSILIRGTIDNIVMILVLLAIPFHFIKSLFSKDKKDSDPNFSEISTNLVSNDKTDEFIESTGNNNLENSQDLEKNNDAIGMVVGISVTLVSTFVVAVV